MFVRCPDLFRFFLSPCVRKRTFWRKDRQFCQLSAVWTSFGGHVKLSSANGGRRKGRGVNLHRVSGLRLCAERAEAGRLAYRNWAWAADEAEVGEIASPLSASSAPFSVENRSVSAESGEFFTATFRLRCSSFRL